MGENTQKSTSVTREFSSGGVVHKNGGGRVLWLVTRSNPTKLYPEEYWRLPKGWIDDIDGGLTPGPIASGERKATESDLQKAALKEVGEEGGVEGRILKKIGTFRYFNGRGLKFVTFYLMEWVRDLPGGFGFETAEVRWLEFGEAWARLNNKIEKEVLGKAKNILM